MKNLLFYFLFFNFLITYGQPSIVWQNTFGGIANDYLVDLKVTSDGGIICGGVSYSNMSGSKSQDCRGGADYWILKLDSLGTKEWDKTFGGSLDDVLFSLQQTSDGGYILGGRSASDSSGDKLSFSNGLEDYWILKLDEHGAIQWQRSYGGNDEDVLHSIQETWDHGYIVGGFSTSNISGNKTENCIGSFDYWILRLDSMGNFVWQNTIGGDDLDVLYRIIQTTDHNFILAGYSASDISGDKDQNSSSEDFWIIKVDQTGNIIWQKTIGGSGEDELTSVIETSDGGFILAGSSNSGISGNKAETCRGLDDYWIVKLNSIGNIEWQRTFGGSDNDNPWSLIETDDGHFLIGGYSSSNISGDKIEDSKGSEDFWVIKLNQLGGTIWQKDIGGNLLDELWAIDETNNNEFIFGGLSISDVSGDKISNRIGLTDFWILKTDFDSGVIKNDFENEILIYPNPFHSNLLVESKYFNNNVIEIYNVNGIKISEIKISERNQILSMQYLIPGSYIFIIKDQDKIITRIKFIKTN